MPVKIGSFEVFPDEEFTALRQQKRGTSDPGMIDLLNELEAGTPVRVPLGEGQSARGLRVAISRAATNRGMSVETLEGDGFVAVRKVDQPRGRKATQGSADGTKRRGRPPKRQTEDQAVVSSFGPEGPNLATGES
jgi:hypothetical protein